MQEMYDLAEKAYPYEQIREEKQRILNEDAHRRNLVSFSSYGAGSGEVSGSTLFGGLAFAYLFTRRGARHMLDFSTMRHCYAYTFGLYMTGAALGTMYRVQQIHQETSSGRTLNLHRRVHQNEQTHALIRSMKFHLNTRQMGIWDADPR